MSLSVPIELFHWFVDYGTLPSDSAVTVADQDKCLVNESFLPRFLNGLILGKQLSSLIHTYNFTDKISFASLLELSSDSAKSHNWNLICSSIQQLFSLSIPDKAFQLVLQGDISLVIKICEEIHKSANKLIIQQLSVKRNLDLSHIPSRQVPILFPKGHLRYEPTPTPGLAESDLEQVKVDFSDFLPCFHSPLLDVFEPSKLSTRVVTSTTPSIHKTTLDFLTCILSNSFSISSKKAGMFLTSQRHVISALFSIGEGSINTSSIDRLTLQDFHLSRWTRVESFISAIFTNIDHVISFISRDPEAELPLLLSVVAPCLIASKFSSTLPSGLAETCTKSAVSLSVKGCILISELIRRLLLSNPESNALNVFISWLLTPSISLFLNTVSSLSLGDVTLESGLFVFIMGLLTLNQIDHVSENAKNTFVSLVDSILSLDYDRFLSPSSAHSIRNFFSCNSSFIEFLLVLLPVVVNGPNKEYFEQSSIPLSLIDYTRDRIVNSQKSIKTRCSCLKLLCWLWINCSGCLPGSLGVVVTDVMNYSIFPTNFNEPELIIEGIKRCFNLLDFCLNSPNSSLNNSAILGPFFFSALVRALLQYWMAPEIRSLILDSITLLLNSVTSIPVNLVFKSLVDLRRKHVECAVYLSELRFYLKLIQVKANVDVFELFKLLSTMVPHLCTSGNNRQQILIIGFLVKRMILDSSDTDRFQSIVIESIKNLIDHWKSDWSEDQIKNSVVFISCVLSAHLSHSCNQSILTLIEEYIRMKTRLTSKSKSSEADNSLLSFLTAFRKRDSFLLADLSSYIPQVNDSLFSSILKPIRFIVQKWKLTSMTL
ncbi:hypothetical protein GEMRC1_013031 [Eukaryota sp. GEM-RC1]